MNIYWSLGVAIISFLGGFMVEHWHDSGQIRALSDQVQVCGNALTTQNNAVIAEKAASDAKIAASQKAIAAAKLTSQQAVNQANSLKAQIGKGETCNTAVHQAKEQL